MLASIARPHTRRSIAHFAIRRVHVRACGRAFRFVRHQRHDLLADRVRGTKAHVVFTAHSLPERIREWDNAGREVYAYFNNDGDGHAVRNALTLRRLLEGG